MKKLLIGTLVLFNLSFSFAETVSEFVEMNSLKRCSEENVNAAEFLSFRKNLKNANLIGKEYLYNTTFYLSDGSESAEPNFIDCLFLGSDCKQQRRIVNIEIPSNALFEIINNNSNTATEKSSFSRLGYGSGSVTSPSGYLDIDVQHVAGEESKLWKITEKFHGYNYYRSFANKYMVDYYCR